MTDRREYHGLHLTEEQIQAIEKSRQKLKDAWAREIGDNLDRAVLRELSITKGGSE